MNTPEGLYHAALWIVSLDTSRGVKRGHERMKNEPMTGCTNFGRGSVSLQYSKGSDFHPVVFIRILAAVEATGVRPMLWFHVDAWGCVLHWDPCNWSRNICIKSFF